MDLYTDACIRNGCTGLGYVIISYNTYEGNMRIEQEHDSVSAEMLGVLEGLRVASQYQRGEIDIHTDCEPVTYKFEQQQPGEKWADYKQSFDWLTGKFDDYKLHHIPRKNNTQADRRAKEATYPS